MDDEVWEAIDNGVWETIVFAFDNSKVSGDAWEVVSVCRGQGRVEKGVGCEGVRA